VSLFCEDGPNSAILAGLNDVFSLRNALDSLTKLSPLNRLAGAVSVALEWLGLKYIPGGERTV
jgi:hypothetical protein